VLVGPGVVDGEAHGHNDLVKGEDELLVLHHGANPCSHATLRVDKERATVISGHVLLDGNSDGLPLVHTAKVVCVDAALAVLVVLAQDPDPVMSERRLGAKRAQRRLLREWPSRLLLSLRSSPPHLFIASQNQS